MNQREWRDAVQRLQRLLEPNCHSVGHVPRSNRDWGTYREYPRYTVPEPHGSDVGRKELSPSSHHVYSKVPEVEDPDGEPLQESEEDAELARKKKQLREIEERIMHKKASIAMKAVFVENSTPPGVSGGEQPATREGETLRNRVKEILMQRQHLSHLSKVQSARKRKNSSSPSKGGVLQEQHPLKLRVKALMKRRHSVLPSNSEEVPDVPQSPPGRSVTSPAKREDIINKGFECFLSVLNKGVDISLLKPEDDCGKVPDVSLLPPSRSISSPAKEENNINKGFERFLNILNKGVDIEKLSRIMSNDREDLRLGEEPLNIQLPDMESKSDPPFRSERQRTKGKVTLLGLNQASEKQQLTRGALLEGLSQTNKRLLSMDNDGEPDLSRTKESQRLSSGASMLGVSPASENQHSDGRPIILSLSRASESQRLKSGASLKDLSQPNESISSGGSWQALSKASDSEQSNSGVLLTSLKQTKESQRLNTGTSLPGLSPPSENQRSNTRPILVGLSRASESQRLKSGDSQKGLSQTNKSISSGASQPVLSKASDSEQTDSGASPSGRSPPCENQRSNARPILLSLSRAHESQGLKSGALLKGLSQTDDGTSSGTSWPGLSRAKDSERSDSGALLTGLSQASKNQQSNSGTFLKSLSQASKNLRLKRGVFIPGLCETSDSESESTDGSPLAGLSQAKETEDPPRRPHRDLKSGASLVARSRTNITETKINSPSREQPLSERLSLPAAEEKKKDRGDHSLGSTIRSKSLVAVKKKKKEEEREENPSVSEHREQLQNILKTLGWNLDVEELSKLANRTQERLYGSKNEGADSREEHESRPKRSHDRDCRKSSSSHSPLRSNKTDRSQERMYGRKSDGRRRTESRGEEETQQRRSLRDHRKSPSSSSSSSSSRSASSPSPPRQRRSRSRDLKQRRKAERSRSEERSRERLKHRDRRNSREAQRDRDRKDLKHFSAYPHPQNQMFPHPAASAFPGYILSQYSHFALSHSGHYSGATNPYWTYNQYNIPSTLSASSHPYPHFSGSVVAPNMVYPDPSLLAGSASFPNPDLSVSEGQVGSSSGPRCLTVINTEQASSQGLTGGHNWRLGYNELMGDFRNHKNILEKHKNTPKSPVAPQESKVCTKTVDDDPSAEQVEEEKPQPTEEEIKANLRKKLEAFNQKAKNTSQLPHSKVMQPANSLISEIE